MSEAARRVAFAVRAAFARLAARARRAGLCALATVGALGGFGALDARGATPRAAAADAATYRIEDALLLRGYSNFVWSRDGSKLAFVVSETDTTANTTLTDLWLHDVVRRDTRRLTRHAAADGGPTFSPGGDTIAWVSSRGEKPAVWMMSLRGGEPWAFGAWDEPVGEVHWSPDGRWLAYVETDTLPAALRAARKQGWDQVVEHEFLQYPHLGVAEVATGKRHRLTHGAQYVWNVRWSPDSKRLAYLVSPTGQPDDGNLVDIGLATPGGAPPRRLGTIGAAFAWSPDGRWLAWAGAGAERETHVAPAALWLAAAAGGAPVNLTPGANDDVGLPAWSAGSDTLWFHSAVGATTVLSALAVPAHAFESARRGAPRGDAAVIAAPIVRVHDRAGWAGAPIAAANGRLAWLQSDPLHPDEVWIADHPRAAGRTITDLNAAVARRTLGTTRTFSWLSDDGTRIEAVLMRPPGARPNAALKTLVWLHGGPHGDRAHLGFAGWQQWFATRGYQVFLPNFRASGGYGPDFMVRRRADWGGQDWRDVSTGVDSLVRAGLADPARLAVCGRSYGGYLAAWAVTQTRRFDAAVSICGAVDLASLWGQSDVPQYRAWEFGGVPWEAGEAWRRSSPMTHITAVTTPTLILAFSLDRRIPEAQSLEFYRALRARGVATQLVRYPRESHVPREYRHRADQYVRMLGWFDRWVK